MKSGLYPALFIAIALGACAATATPDAAESGAAEPAVSACGMERYQSLIGQSTDAVEAAAMPERARVICQGCMVTMDYVENRLNIWLDGDGNVERLTCG